MYFPYLRGRQYELLALQELVKQQLICPQITPIVEPVKFSTTLIKTISSYVEAGHSISVIGNPVVGSFLREWKNARQDEKAKEGREKFANLYKNDYTIKSTIIRENTNELLKKWNKNHFSFNKVLTICTNPEMLDVYEQLFSDSPPAYNLIPDESIFRRRIRSNRILLADSFDKLSRNADYNDSSDDYFSENHLYYRDDGYIGFSDYSIIGNSYQDKGFAPYAVAIHIVFFNEKRALRVIHFVSDSNDDINNPAMKFYQAVSKLYKWYQENRYSIPLTVGLKAFLQHYEQQTYPGLGTIKKLSLMHHLELMSTFLSGVN